MRLHQFLEDSDERLSMSRLGMLVGLIIGTVIAIGAAVLYFLHALDASVFSNIYHTFIGTTSGGYVIGKGADAFGSEGKATPEPDVEEDATP